MTGLTGRGWVLLLAAMLTTTAAACGAPARPHVATARSAAPPVPQPGTPAAETDYDKAQRYTRCMTANGVVTPDPVAGQALVTVNIVHAGDSPAAYDARRAAFAKCRQFLPTTWPLKVDPDETVRTRQFVACARKHGVDWPEADASGLAAWPTDPDAMTGPAYDAAIRACRHLLDDPANGLPENQ